MDYRALLSNDILFADFKNGDDQAFKTVYEAFKGVIYITTSKIVRSDETAEDITVNTFLRVWERRDGIQNMAHLKNLLFIIARNLSINELNRRDNNNHELTDKVFGELDQMHHEDYAKGELFAELVEQIHKIIKQMPELRGRILQLRFFEEMPPDEIATALGISRSSVYYHTQEAMLILRTALYGDRSEKHALTIALTIILCRVAYLAY